MALLLFFSREDTFRSMGCKLQNRDLNFPSSMFLTQSKVIEIGQSNNWQQLLCLCCRVVKLAKPMKTIALQTVLEIDSYTNRQLMCKNTTSFCEILVSASLKSWFTLVVCGLWTLDRLFAIPPFQIQLFYVFSKGKSIVHHWQIVCSPKAGCGMK